MILDIVKKLLKKESLTPEEMSGAMETIASGVAGAAEIEKFLLALREKGETVSEITAAVRVMRKHAVHLSKNYPELLDTCGTGGDNQRTFNVSTLSAIVACAAGAKVGKHGNRHVSSVCGSADLLEMLGVKINSSPQEIERSIEKTGFGFFFAPLFHPAAKFAVEARKKIKGKTIFNILGPLSNPAGAAHQLIGVYEEKLVPVLAKALFELGTQKAMVVHGKEGMDEISISDITYVAEIGAGKIRRYKIKPEDFGFRCSPVEFLRCDTKEKNIEEAERILKGEKNARAEIVCLNAGAALFVAEKTSSLFEGVKLAQKTLENGGAYKKLEEIISFTQKMKAEGSE